MEHPLIGLGCWGPTPVDMGGTFCVLGVTSHLSVRTIRLSFVIALAAFVTMANDWIVTTSEILYINYPMDWGWIVMPFVILPGIALALFGASLRSGMMLPKFTAATPRVLGWIGLGFNLLMVFAGP